MLEILHSEASFLLLKKNMTLKKISEHNAIYGKGSSDNLLPLQISIQCLRKKDIRY